MIAASKTARPVQALAPGILRWLASVQASDGSLHDPVTGAPLPPVHYGTPLFAAACALTDVPTLLQAGGRAARHYLALPSSARGAYELSNLGLLSLYEHWDRIGAPRSLRSGLATYLRRMPFASLGGGNVTNNWHAMRAVCLARRGRLLGRAEDVHAAAACLRTVVLPLQDGDGLFADYPPPGRAGDRMTPLTYHAKVCAMLAMFLREAPDAAAAAALERGVDALAQFCAPDGQALYYGRSGNSAYGCAAALYALAQAQALEVAGGNELARCFERIAEFLTAMAQPDGGLRPYPAPEGTGRRGWDDYVERVDYSAFTAFLLLQTPVVRPAVQVDLPPRTFVALGAGLFACERDGVFAALSTRGQLHAGSYMFADARYAGMQPLLVQHGGQTIVPPPPHDAAAPVDATWCGYVPVVVQKGETFAVRTYDEVRMTDEGCIAAAGRGVPVALRPDRRRRLAGRATGRSGAGFIRWAARLSRRLGAKMPPPFTVLPAAGVRVSRAIVLLPRARCLVFLDKFDGDYDAAWSTVRLPGPVAPLGDGWWAVAGVPHIRLSTAGAGTAECREVFTSNGSAWVLRVPVSPGQVHVATLCFGGAAPVRVDVQPPARAVIAADGEAFRVAVDLEALRVSRG